MSFNKDTKDALDLSMARRAGNIPAFLRHFFGNHEPPALRMAVRKSAGELSGQDAFAGFQQKAFETDPICIYNMPEDFDLTPALDTIAWQYLSAKGAQYLSFLSASEELGHQSGTFDKMLPGVAEAIGTNHALFGVRPEKVNHDADSWGVVRSAGVSHLPCFVRKPGYVDFFFVSPGWLTDEYLGNDEFGSWRWLNILDRIDNPDGTYGWFRGLATSRLTLDPSKVVRFRASF
jgi:hypothetical protein